MAKDQTSTEATQEIVEENVETTDAGSRRSRKYFFSRPK